MRGTDYNRRRALWLALGWLASGAAAAAAPAGALQVRAPWVRATLPGQAVAGFYATLLSPAGGRLVAVESPVARRAEIHAMSMDGGVMRMRQLAALRLPAGEAVVLQPGGLHIMLFEPLRPLRAGDTVDLTLVVEAGGVRTRVPVRAAVRED